MKSGFERYLVLRFGVLKPFYSYRRVWTGTDVVAGEPTKKGFRLFHRITWVADGAVIALVETGMASYDYDKERLQPLLEAQKNICLPDP